MVVNIAITIIGLTITNYDCFVLKNNYSLIPHQHMLYLGVLLNKYKLRWGLENFLLYFFYKLTYSSYFYKVIVKYLFTKSNF